MEIVTNDSRIAKNTLFLYVRMFFVLIITLFTARIILQTLGVIDYGVYNTVAGFVMLFAFLNSTLSASIQRFYNFETARSGSNGCRNVYSVGVIIHVFVMLVILALLEPIGIWYVNNVMVIPSDRLYYANILFQTSVASLCLLVISIPYSGAILAAERMDYYAVISILDTLLKLFCVIALNYLPYDKLGTYGVLLLIESFLVFMAYYLYAKRNILLFSFNTAYDKQLLRQMLSFSSWNVIGTFAFAMKGQALNMLLNFFFGPIINAARGIAFQVGNAVTSFSTNITVAFKPQMVTSYSKGDFNRTKYLFYIQSKICFALIAILITPIILNIDYVLKLWLGSDIPQYTPIFSILVLIDALVCSFNAPCTQLILATGQIKNYQIASSIVNILLLPTSWFFLHIGCDPVSTFVVTIIFSILNQIVCIWQMTKVIQIKVATYLHKVILPSFIFLCLCPIPGYISFLFLDQSLFRLILVVGVSVVWGCGLIIFCLFSQLERNKLLQYLKNKFVH